MGGTTSLEGCITLGNWGGSGGEGWMYTPKGIIRKITIAHGGAIDSLTFLSMNREGSIERSKFGGKGGSRFSLIEMDYPDEYLTSISGTYGTFDGRIIVKSLCFDTNYNRYGRYGPDEGTRFSYDGKGGVIVGFHGRAGKYVDAIGVYVMPESIFLLRNSICDKDSAPEEVLSLEKEANLDSQDNLPDSYEGCVAIGYWGGQGGEYWTYKPTDGHVITRIIIVHGPSAIHSIMFKSIDPISGSCDFSRRFGGSGGDRTDTIDIDGTAEYLTGINGTCGSLKVFGPTLITSLQFTTNIARYGPFGPQHGHAFVCPLQGGVIVGFKGRAGNFLDAIGIHTESISAYSLLTGKAKTGDNKQVKEQTAGGGASNREKRDMDVAVPIGTVQESEISTRNYQDLTQQISEVQGAIGEIVGALEGIEGRLDYQNYLQGICVDFLRCFADKDRPSV